MNSYVGCETQIKKYVLDYPGVYLSKEISKWYYGTVEEAQAAGWLTTKQARQKYSTDEEFYSALMDITQFSRVAAEQHSYTAGVWQLFEDKIDNFLNIFNQEDLLRSYLLHVLEFFIKNGYSRVELRAPLFPIKRRNPAEMLYEKDVVKIYEEVEQELQKKYPYFTIGLIVFGLKIFNPEQLEKYFRMAYSIESHLIIGIDMVQEEDIHPEFDTYEPTIRKIQQ